MRFRLLTATVLIAFGALLRLIPHPWNFAPLGAIALYGGAQLGPRLRFVVPLAALLISDAVIGFYRLPVMLAVYGSFSLIVLIGRWVGRKQSIERIATGALSGSILFFLITNAAVWAFGHGYQATGAGLLHAYAAGLPFFRNTVLSDVFYSAVFFGLTAAVTAFAKRHQLTTQSHRG